MNILTILLCWCLSLVPIFFLIIKLSKDKEKTENIIHFERYATIFEYYLIKAYDIIHKDRILIYSLEATKLNESEFKQVAKDFGKLFLQLIGPSIQKELTKFYGNEKVLMFNVIEFFNTKFEDDEIRKNALDNLAAGDSNEDN